MMQRQWIYRGTAIALVLGLMLFAVVSVISGATRKHRPDVALGLRPGDALAQANLASRLQLDKSLSAPAGTVQDLARASLRRDLTRALAVSAWALEPAPADRAVATKNLMDFSDRLTKRERRSQIWLMEHKAKQGDIAGMLRHFEAISSVSPNATSIMFPMLVGAFDDPAVVSPMEDMLVKEPWWADSLLMGLAKDGTSSQNVERLFLGMAQRGHPPRKDIAQLMVQRLIDEGRRSDAETLAKATGIEAARN